MEKRDPIHSFFEPLVQKYDHESLTEFMVNPDGSIWLEVAGKTFHTGDFMDEKKREFVLRIIAGENGKVINRDCPDLSVRLPKTVFNRGRFQGIYPPLSEAPMFTVRVPPKKVFTIENFIESGSMTERQARQLSDFVHDKKNILIAGGTGSGKTTLATTLLSLIKDDRIVVIEDDPEIITTSKHVINLQTTPSRSIRDCVFFSLRLNPDRIIVGEIRDGATASDLVQAWLTGHPGGIGTVHSSSAAETKNRIYSLMQQVHVTPNRADIDAAIQVVVFVGKVHGKRKIIEIKDFS